MLLRSCLSCEYHLARERDGNRMSFCQKENCLSCYSKCVAMRAIKRFLEQECCEAIRPSSALELLYGGI